MEVKTNSYTNSFLIQTSTWPWRCNIWKWIWIGIINRSNTFGFVSTKDKGPYFITELISIPIMIRNPLKTKTKKEPRAFYGKIWEQDAFQHTQNKLMNENTHKSLLIQEISTNQAKTCHRKANIHTLVRNRDTNININCLKYTQNIT